MNYFKDCHSIVSKSIGMGFGDGESYKDKGFICIMLPYEKNPFFDGYDIKRNEIYNWYALTPEAARELYELLKTRFG